MKFLIVYYYHWFAYAISQVQGAYLKALSHYYAALIHITIVRELMKTEKGETCELHKLYSTCSPKDYFCHQLLLLHAQSMYIVSY